MMFQLLFNLILFLTGDVTTLLFPKADQSSDCN